MSKHLAFLLDKDNKVFLFPGYYEDLKQEIDGKYEEVEENILNESNWFRKDVNYFTSLQNESKKVFKLKSKIKTNKTI